MNVVLRADVDGVGKKGDICVVSEGYARNFLFPRELAIRASVGAEGQAEAMRRARSVRDAADREAAEEIAKSLVSKVIPLTARASEEGRLFGSISSTDVAQAVEDETAIVIDRKRVQLEEPLKTVGSHSVMVRLHESVEFPLTVDITGITG